MGFKFGNVLGGAGKGAAAGSAFGLPGVIAGALGGGTLGGFSKDIDKGLTGNSGSGTVNKGLNIAGIAGGAAGLAKLLAGGGGNGLMSLFGGGGSGTSASPLGFSSTPGSFTGAGLGSNMFLGPNVTSGSGAAASTVSAGSTSGNGSLSKFFGGLVEKNPLAALGLGSTALGLFAGRSPDVPDLPQSVEDYRKTAQAGGGPLGQLGQSKLTELINQPFSAVSQGEEDAALRGIQLNQDQELKQIQDVYRSLRPGTDYTTDSTYQRDIGQLNDRYARTKADTLSQLHRQVYNDYQGQQLQRVLGAGSLDAQSQEQLQQVAQWDTDRISAQFGIDYNDAQQLKSFLTQEGALLFNSGVGTKDNTLEKILAAFKPQP